MYYSERSSTWGGRGVAREGEREKEEGAKEGEKKRILVLVCTYK